MNLHYPQSEKLPVAIAAFAVEGERIAVRFPGMEVVNVVTGIGKANAAMAITEACLRHNPAFVVNIGTAGTFAHSVGDIIVSRHFIDRDLASAALPGVVAEIKGNLALPFRLSSKIACGRNADDLTISTGDDFVTEGECPGADVVDMEAFAEALVCHRFGIPFVSVKYVTDVIGQNSTELWAEKLEAAREGLTLHFEKIEY